MAAPPSTIQSSDSRDSITTRQTVFTEATDVFYDAKSRFDSASIASGYSRGSKISLTDAQHIGRKKSQKKKKKSEEIPSKLCLLSIKVDNFSCARLFC